MKARIISFQCTVTNRLGHRIGSSFNHEVVAFGDEVKSEGLLGGLVKNLGGLEPGQRKQIFLPAEEAYGFYDDKLVVRISKRKLEHTSELRIGDQVGGELENGSFCLFRITQIAEKHVTLDGNHPLAGEDLIVDVEATGVRDATPDDLNRENAFSAHGPLLH